MQKRDSDPTTSANGSPGEDESALANEAMLSAVLDALPVGVVIADANGRVVRSNAAHYAIWGIPPETIHWTEYARWVGWNPRTGKRIQAHEWAMTRALLKGEVIRGEPIECQPFHGGPRRFFINNAAPVRDMAGHIIAGVVAELDVTTEKETALERERLLRAERAARHRTEQLQALTATLSAARTCEEIARATLEVGSRVAGTTRGTVCRVVDNEATSFELIAALGYEQETLQRWRSQSLRSTPAGDAVRSQQPVVVARHSELLERYPEVRAIIERERISGTAAFPMLGMSNDANGAVVVRGFVSFDFDHEHDLVESEIEFLRTIAQLCAQAVDRARLYETDRAAREQLESVLTAINEGFFTLDRQWRMTYVNPRGESMLRATREELLGRSIWDVYPLLIGTVFERNYREAMEQSEPMRFEAFYTPMSVWVEVRVYATPDGLAVYFQDITARHEATERLRAREAQLQAIFDAAPVGLFFTSASDGRILTANRRAAEMLGRPDLLSSNNLRSERHTAVCEDGRPFELKDSPLLRALNGEPHEVKALYTRPDGRRIWVRGIGEPIRDDAGNVTGALTVMVDMDSEYRAIDAFKELTEQLQQTQLRLDAALDAGRMGVWHWNCNTGEARWNRQMFEMVGLPPNTDGHIDPGTFLSIVHPDDRSAIRESIRKGITDCSPYEFETRIIRTDAEVRWLLCRARVTSNEQGQAIDVTGVNIDITDQKMAQQSLLEIDRRRNEFLAMLGHELRNPLAPISNAVRLLERSELREEQRGAAVQIIKRQSAHLARLVDDLLEVSRVTQGRIELRKENILAMTSVLSAAEAVRPLIREQGQTLTIDVPTDVHVFVDPARLTQILANLLGNAAKYTQHGGHISVHGRVTDGRWFEIAVVDNGAGIEPESLPRIFDLFEQGAATIDRSRGGLGLGLALVQRLIELHGGGIHAASEGVGKGATFTIRLPLPMTERHGTHAAAEDTLLPIEPKSILVVDDNADAALSLATLLESDGHNVRVAYEGTAALEAARTFKPDVVLLDIGLPQMDGYAVASALRRDEELFKNTVIIAVTGYGQAPDREQSRLAGFDAHLLKPAELADIYRAIGKR